MKARPLRCWLPLALLLHPAILPCTFARLDRPAGLWQLNGNFNSTQRGYAALDASTIVSGTDYTFGLDVAGYHHLRTQIFTPALKRLTVPNPVGPNGGTLASRTNQWAVVMDVMFDSFAPYAGLLQLDASNTSDVSFYLQPGSVANRGTLVSGNVAVSADNAFVPGVWFRLALTCENNGANSAPTVRCYLNGEPNGQALVTSLNGPLSMASTFHLFSDNNGELRPARLAFLGLWGETLRADEIARLGSASPEGVEPASLSYPDAPATWGTWEQSSYAASPRRLSAAADPDERLRLFFTDAQRSINQGGTALHPAVMFTYRLPKAAPRVEMVTAFDGKSLDQPLQPGSSDLVTAEAMNLPRRMKVVTSDRGQTFAVRTMMTAKAPGQSVSGITNSSKEFSEPLPNPYFSRRPWVHGLDVVFGDATFTNFASDIALTPSGAATLYARLGNGAAFGLNVETAFGRHLGGLDFPLNWNSNRTLQAVDLAVTQDTRDLYYAVSSTRQDGPGTESEVRVYRHTKLPGAAGNTIYDNGRSEWLYITNRPAPAAQAAFLYPKMVLTRTGEPRWVMWSEPLVSEIRLARRIAPTPDNDPSTNEDRRIGSYKILDRVTPGGFDQYFARGFGVDAAMDSQNRLHVVWQGTETNPLVHYARENASGTFDEITLPGGCSQPPSLAIGPDDYPYVAFAGPAGAGGPLTVAVPPYLKIAYKADFDDLDGDNRPGLFERGQGTSDYRAESPSELFLVPLQTGVTTASSGLKYGQIGFRLAYRALREPGTTKWHLADGTDTITIEPAYSAHLRGFNTGGFDFSDDNRVSTSRYVSVQDVISVNAQPKQFYRLHVTRTHPSP